MRFTSPIVFLTLLCIFALVAGDKYIHFSDPGCPILSAGDCNDIHYCHHHRYIGDIFDSQSPYLKIRDVLSSSNSTPKQSNVNEKRQTRVKPIECGTLSEANRLQYRVGLPLLFLGRITTLSPTILIRARLGVDIQILVPPPFYLFCPQSWISHYLFRLIGRIGIFAVFSEIIHNYSVERIGQARTDIGSVRFRFQAIQDASYYQVIFLGDGKDGAIKLFILQHWECYE